MSFERARKIADAVLYEGYLLYPYRASSRKNQLRFQFGVLAPRDWSVAGGSEHWWMNTDCIVEAEKKAKLIGKVRFLQVQRRIVEVTDATDPEKFREVDSIEIDGRLLTSWEEGIEREVVFESVLNELGADERLVHFAFEPARCAEPVDSSHSTATARIVRDVSMIAGVVRIKAERINGSLIKLSARIENLTPWQDANASRDEVLRASFVGAHTILSISDGSFVSLTDPPEWALASAARCSNIRTWPVLIGAGAERDVVLSSPIILQDYPEIAPESPGDLFDATEIDEILTLRTMTLTDEEKREARATDPRASAIIDRVDAMPPEMLDRLHGAMRYLRDATGQPASIKNDVPWWDPGADASVSPETDSVEIDGIAVSKGRRVLLRPGARRADAQDMFLAGRIAEVQGVFIDVENRRYLAVTLEDDPAAEFHQWHGRYFYFSPDEVEPLESRN
jgi:hypothetical protein